MKIWIGEYGRLVVMVCLGTCLLVLLRGAFLNQMRERISIGDAPVKSDRPSISYGSVPILKGLDKNGKTLALKIPAGAKFSPLYTEDMIQVQAVDEKDGDITDQIQVYVVGEKAVKERLTGNLDTSGKKRHYILSYEVTNSSGFWTGKRISVLITESGGKG